MKHYFILAFVIILSLNSYAQSVYNHPEIDWQTIETEHFKIHFYSDTEILAREAAGILEYVYPYITDLYQYEPKKKTDLIFTDTEDVANGVAYYYDNKMIIWASPLDIALRGSHKWLENVLTHEFTHIISIQKAMKAGTKVPGAFLQWISYEKETHQNVLYGYPNAVVSYPIPAAVVPPWLAEGTAQHMYGNADWDTWDSHRDMILRDQALNDNLLSFEAINTFGKCGIGNESVYNSGYAFVNYIIEKFGEETLRILMEELSNPFQYSIDKVIEKTTGIGGKELYKKYSEELIEKYKEATESIIVDEGYANIIQSVGTTNLYPKWSKSGQQYAYISNKNNDYFGQTDLFIYDFSSKEDKKIASGVQSAPTWGVGDSVLYYSKKPKMTDTKGYRYFDLYAYDIIKDKETRLTNSSRAISPVFIEYLNSIAYIAMDGGKQSIFLFSLDKKEISKIKVFDDARILHNLFYDDNERRIIFDYTTHHFRNVASLSLSDFNVVDIISGDNDERDMCMENNGNLLFSSDVSGIYNLVQYDSSGYDYITNVKGGAFMPDVSKDGKLLFSSFQDGGYKIALIDSPKVVQKVDCTANCDTKYRAPINNPNTSVSEKYSDSFTDMFIMPRIMFDYGTIKPGFYFYSSEVLEKLSLNGGLAINFDKDIDFSFNLAFRKLYPTIYTDFMYSTRNTIEKSKYSVYDIDDKLRFRFVLMRAGLQFPFYGNEVIDIYTQWQRYRAFIKENISSFNTEAGYAYDYYRGLSTGINFGVDNIKTTVDRDINPSKGHRFKINVAYELNDFIDGLNLSNSGTLVEEFAPNNYFKIDAIASYHITILPSKRWTVSLSAKGGWLSNSEVESFFNYFGGGLDGIQGYPYYSFEGTNSMLTEVAVRIPIFRQAHLPIGWMIWQNSTIGLEYQLGDTWTEDFDLKHSIGVQLRFNGFSFYNYPTAFGLEIHRGLTSFTKYFNGDEVNFGNENRYYLTLLFGF